MLSIMGQHEVVDASDILDAALRDMDEVIQAAEYSKICHFCNQSTARQQNKINKNSIQSYTDNCSNVQPQGDLQWNVDALYEDHPESLSNQTLDTLTSFINCILVNPQEVSVIYSKLSVYNQRILSCLFDELHQALDKESSKQSAMNRTGIFRSATSPNPFTESHNSPTSQRKLTGVDLNGQVYQSSCSPNSSTPLGAPSNGISGWNQTHPAGLCTEQASTSYNLDLLNELARQQMQIASLEQAKRSLEFQLQELRGRFAGITKPTESHTLCSGSMGDQFQQPHGSVQIKNASLIDGSIEKSWLNGQNLRTSNSLGTPFLPGMYKDGEHQNASIASPPQMNFSSLQRNNFAPSTLPSHPLTQHAALLPRANQATTIKEDQLNHTQYKSLSLNELCQPQLNILDEMSFATSPRPPLASDLTRYGASVTNFMRAAPSASASVAVMNHLPPQYASKHHRQAHLFGKSPSPLTTTPPDFSRIAQTESNTPDPLPVIQNPMVPTTSLANLSTSTHQSPPVSPLVRRAKTPTEKWDRYVIHPMTTSKQMCHSEGRVPIITLNDNELLTNPTNYAISRSGSTKTTKNSRIKHFFAETRAGWLRRPRNVSYTPQTFTDINVSPKASTLNRDDLIRDSPKHRSASLRLASPMINAGPVNSYEGNGIFDQSHDTVLRENAHLGAEGSQKRNTMSRQSVPCLPTSQLSKFLIGSRREDPSSIKSGTIPHFIQTSCFEVNATGESEDIDFIHWDKDVVSAWMYELGLGYAVPATRRWLRRGADLVYASRKDIEQEMGIRNPLHLKKLLLHMQLRTNEPLLICPSLPLLRMKLPPEFNIAAWLDDLGLTTYTAVFSAAGIDPVTLNNLTMNDLFSMKITNELHVLSIRRGLQILRRIRFNLSALSRGPANGESSFDAFRRSEVRFQKPQQNGSVQPADNGFSVEVPGKQYPFEQQAAGRPGSFLHGEPIPDKSMEQRRVASICYWTQYRVMTWLYAIELPEYAPDLSGSGVHGALMVLEDRFTPELLANILHVPVNKTLVRRHLTSKFAELVGEDIWQRKLDAINNPTIPVLTQHSKLKLPKKRGFFIPQRKHKGFELDDTLVCPLDIDTQHPDLFIDIDCPTDSIHSESPSVQLNVSQGDWTPSQSLSTESSDPKSEA